ncbi:MAG: ATP-binding protein, partial [Gammaproteobacteria bacterium]|nr:ATP-binding protein [Gammaproteobacteria bacterium]
MSAKPPESAPASLVRRLLLVATVVLVAFLGLTGLALDRAFRASVVELSRERLQARIYLLMAAAEVSRQGEFSMTEPLADPRLAVGGSGAFAAVSDAEGRLLWRSASSLTVDLDYPQALAPGRPALGEASIEGAGAVLALTYPVVWELGRGSERYLVFHAAELRANIDAEAGGFPRALWLWLAGSALLLLAAQLAMLAWALAPLRQVARDMQEIEAGRQRELRAGYPRELRPLTENLNRLLASNRTRLQRYRDALADLAHSLKTPLAVLKTALDGAAARGPEAQLLREQIERMQRTIDYQLQRAAASGPGGLGLPVEVLPVAARVVRALEKLHAGRDRPVVAAIDIDPGVRFPGDPGDLEEILGNLADNAFKWAASRMSIRARNTGEAGIELEVADDGPGIPEPIRAERLRRGMRLDSAVPGHGIGLAVVRDIVEQAYGGRLEILAPEGGGTRVRVLVPETGT